MMGTEDPKSPGRMQRMPLLLQKGISKFCPSYKILVIPKGSCWLYGSEKAAETSFCKQSIVFPKEEKNTNFITK